jgi:archaellum component FlaC
MKSFLRQIEEAFEAVDKTNDIIDDQANHVNHLSDEELSLDEISTSADAGSYMTPNAFANAEDDAVEVLGYKKVRESVNTLPSYRPGEYQHPESDEEEYNEKFPFADDDQAWQHAKFKYPTDPLVASYKKYSDRPAHITDKIKVQYDWSGVKNKTDNDVYEAMDSKYEQLIESYRNFKKGDDKPSSKVKRTIQEIATKLREIETLVQYNSRLKTESGVTSSHYGPSTNKALNKISERLIKISERVRALGE